MRRRPLNSRLTGLVLLTLAVGLVGGFLLGQQVSLMVTPQVEVPRDTRAEFELMAEAWRTIEREYVDQEAVVPRRMAHGGIEGMVETLGDPGHTRFLTPDMAERHLDQLRGRFEGIGAYVEMRDGQVVIVAPMDSSPAQEAGLKAEEIILGVNGEDVTDLPLEEVVDRVLGPAGTEVTLTVLNPVTEEEREVTLERAEIHLELVAWQRVPETELAYVRISAFSAGATEQLGHALGEIEEEGIVGLVLDLRDNPGGILGEAVGVTSRFVESGNVVLRRDAASEVGEEAVREDIQAVDLPMVALINGGTASAAEIVTGALQDYERAATVGSTTFGAGTVLNRFPLADGAVVLLAVEEWLTPEGRVIWQRGLAPDVEVDLAPDAEPLVRLRWEDLTEAELRDSGDEQLLRALELLHSSISDGQSQLRLP